MERMWAYMTIKKLLKESNFEGSTSEGKRKKAEALRLSLHVSEMQKAGVKKKKKAGVNENYKMALMPV